ncbi:BMBL-like protein [Mya arenaria]|uniref:BMBL-like protein n=1 Tax=Mya arenaria TaxID=6604 RepID=A0ABY7F818_MYAAR|nr:BMBL-like protein [Mya arenaria]
MMKNCMIRNQFFFIFTVFVLFSSSQALFDWIFGAKSERSSDGNVVMRSSGLKFEVQTADDKFLQLKDVIENLSELDSCNHIVVYKLKKRCGDLSEEDLGKLAVQLLNCQSSIVNNRARALCYATQQQQFRRLAEVTVNELMSSAHGQLQFLKELQKQEATQFESHEKIVADLTHIQQKSHDALNKLDDKLSILTCGALHISYFLFAALAASFLQAPPATRVALFTLVSLNATMEIQCGHNPPYFLSGSLPAPGQTGSQDAEETNQSPDTTTAGSPHDIPLSPVEIKQLTTNLVNESVASETSPGPRGDRSSKTADHSSHLDRPSTSAFTPYRRPEQARPDSSTVTMQRDDIAKVKRYLENLDENTSVSEFDMSETRNNSGARFRHSTPHRPASRGSSSTNRSYCQGITKTGTPCRSGCTNGSEFCHRHRGVSHAVLGESYAVLASAHGVIGVYHAVLGASYAVSASAHGVIGVSHAVLGASYAVSASAHGVLGVSHAVLGSYHGVSISCSVRIISCSVRSISCSVRSILCSVRNISCRVRSISYSVRSILCSVRIISCRNGTGQDTKG